MVVGSEYGNGLSGFVKCSVFFVWLGNWWQLEKGLSHGVGQFLMYRVLFLSFLIVRMGLVLLPVGVRSRPNASVQHRDFSLVSLLKG